MKSSCLRRIKNSHVSATRLPEWRLRLPASLPCPRLPVGPSLFLALSAQCFPELFQMWYPLPTSSHVSPAVTDPGTLCGARHSCPPRESTARPPVGSPDDSPTSPVTASLIDLQGHLACCLWHRVGLGPRWMLGGVPSAPRSPDTSPAGRFSSEVSFPP